jgi:hypothetical protein
MCGGDQMSSQVCILSVICGYVLIPSGVLSASRDTGEFPFAIAQAVTIPSLLLGISCIASYMAALPNLADFSYEFRYDRPHHSASTTFSLSYILILRCDDTACGLHAMSINVLQLRAGSASQPPGSNTSEVFDPIAGCTVLDIGFLEFR